MRDSSPLLISPHEVNFANAFLVTAGFLLILGMTATRGLPADETGDRKNDTTRPYRRLWNIVSNWRQNRDVPR